MDGLDSPKVAGPFKIIHKEQDIITAFAINQVCAFYLISYPVLGYSLILFNMCE